MSQIKSLQDFVKDWGGFEKLVTDMNNSGEVRAEHNVTLTGMSGVPRQIDVLITHRKGLYEYKILGECKYWSQKIKRTHVDAMINAVRDLGASKGVFFTTKGFQSGAKELAEKSGIDLFLVRELEDKEWGLPGRHIHFYLHIVTRSICNLQIPSPLQSYVLDPVAFAKHGPNVHMEFSNDPAKQSKTKIIKPDGATTTLEELIDTKTLEVLNKVFEKPFLFNSGAEGTHYIQQGVNFKPAKPIQVILPGAIILLPEMRFDLGIKVSQSEIRVDRMTPYTYALAVEDCVSQKTFIGAKRTGEEPEITAIEPKTNSDQKSEALKNGAILRITHKSWFDAKEMAHLTPVPVKMAHNSDSNSAKS